ISSSPTSAPRETSTISPLGLIADRHWHREARAQHKNFVMDAAANVPFETIVYTSIYELCTIWHGHRLVTLDSGDACTRDPSHGFPSPLACSSRLAVMNIAAPPELQDSMGFGDKAFDLAPRNVLDGELREDSIALLRGACKGSLKSAMIATCDPARTSTLGRTNGTLAATESDQFFPAKGKCRCSHLSNSFHF